MVKIVKNPGNARLNNLNYPVLNVLTWALDMRAFVFKPQSLVLWKKSLASLGRPHGDAGYFGKELTFPIRADNRTIFSGSSIL